MAPHYRLLSSTNRSWQRPWRHIDGPDQKESNWQEKCSNQKKNSSGKIAQEPSPPRDALLKCSWLKQTKETLLKERSLEMTMSRLKPNRSLGLQQTSKRANEKTFCIRHRGC